MRNNANGAYNICEPYLEHGTFLLPRSERGLLNKGYVPFQECRVIH